QGQEEDDVGIGDVLVAPAREDVEAEQGADGAQRDDRPRQEAAAAVAGAQPLEGDEHAEEEKGSPRGPRQRHRSRAQLPLSIGPGMRRLQPFTASSSKPYEATGMRCSAATTASATWEVPTAVGSSRCGFMS